jgi:probable phosphoglycerate mutase
MDRTRLTIVRHGETDWNVAKRLQGQQDSELTRNGLSQAETVSKTLSRFFFDALISSDLGRAVKTTGIINQKHNLPILTNPNLRERNFGIMEGLTREQIQSNYPEVFNGYMERKDSYIIPEGESLVAFYNRVMKGLQNLAEMYEGKDILIVTHGGVLDCVMRKIFNYPLSAPRRFSIYNASINIMTITGDEWFLEQWGNIDSTNMKSISLDELKR